MLNSPSAGLTPPVANGDRLPGVLEWNLFDIDAKFGDVESVEAVLTYLEGIEPFKSPV